MYEPFYEDFGPLNLGKTHKFVMRTAELLQVSWRGGGRNIGGREKMAGGQTRGARGAGPARPAADTHTPAHRTIAA